MAMGSFDPRRHKPPMADINVVPLVDVTLVLVRVVIFIISTSLLTHSVKIDPPKATSSPNITRPAHIELGIREDGALYWNGQTSAWRRWPAICHRSQQTAATCCISAPTATCITKPSRRWWRQRLNPAWFGSGL